MKKLVLLLTLALLSSTEAFALSPYSNITSEGASNTAGVRSGLDIVNRIQYHLERTVKNPKLQKQLQSQKVIIAFDYFFPSNFVELDNPSLDHRELVLKKLNEWLAKNDRVLVGLLPVWEDLSKEDIYYALNEEVTQGYTNILNYLDEPIRKSAVRVVNQTIREFASKNSKIKIVPMAQLVHESLENYREYISNMYMSTEINAYVAFDMDRLHLNDAGQALLLNKLIFPLLNKQIPPIMSANVPESDVRLMLARTLLKPADLIAGKDGGYWAQLSDKSDFSKKNVIRNKENSPEFKLFADLAGSLESYAQQKDGFPIFIRSNSQGKTLSLELSKALFYTRVDLRQTGVNKFEGWGYDFWMSQGFAKTNYHFVAYTTKDPLKYKLQWTIFPTLPNQETPLARIGLLPESVSSYLKENASQLPSITYEIEVQIIEYK